MPTNECWLELGALRAEVDALRESEKVSHERIRILEDERLRLKTTGGIIGIMLTALGMILADPVKKFIMGLWG